MSTDAPALADRLLDAQVAFHLDRLTGTALAETVARVATGALDAVEAHQIADLIDARDIKPIVTRALTDVPASAAVAGIIEMVRDLVRTGPDEPFTTAEVVDREQVERVVDEALALTPALERRLEHLTASPLVGATVSRFMGRIVGEAVAANQAVADKVPGLGSLVALGTKAAAGVVGVADQQLGGLLADTAGKGGTLAVRRMNRIIIDTLADPTTREAILQVWDLAAAAPVSGFDDSGTTDGLVDAVHDLAITTLAQPPIIAIAHNVVDAFVDRFGGYTPGELLTELDLTRDDVVADLVRLAPSIADALRESGALEQLLRSELAPFYASAEVSDLLGG